MDFTSFFSATPGGGYPVPPGVLQTKRVSSAWQPRAKLETLLCLRCLNRYHGNELKKYRHLPIIFANLTVVPLYSALTAYGVPSSAAQPPAEPLSALTTKKASQLERLPLRTYPDKVRTWLDKPDLYSVFSASQTNPWSLVLTRPSTMRSLEIRANVRRLLSSLEPGEKFVSDSTMSFQV